MTNGHNFKVGDKVRIKDTPLVNPDYVGRICEIASVTAGAYITFKDCDSKWHPYVLELVEPYDRRTSFLRELQALLRKYDASIRDHDYYRVYISLGTHEDINPTDCIVCEDIITADNIMDFDKE